MNSKEKLSVEGLRCAAISGKAMETAVRKGIEIGTQAAIKYIEDKQQEERKSRYKRMLHNTRLLLKNYRLLKEHTENVIFNTNKVKENAIDILDSMDNYVLNDGIYIQRLKQSQQRTIVIVRHIEKMLDIYGVLCARDKETPEAQRRYEVIYDRYIAPEQKSIKEIADCKNMSTRAVYTDIEKAVKSLAALIFGVNSLDTM